MVQSSFFLMHSQLVRGPVRASPNQPSSSPVRVLLEQFGDPHGCHGGHAHRWHGDVLEDGLGDACVGGLVLVQGLHDGLAHVATAITSHRQQGNDVLLPRDTHRYKVAQTCRVCVCVCAVCVRVLYLMSGYLDTSVETSR